MKSSLVTVASVALVGLLVAPASAQKRPPANQRNFLACPVVRDTKTVPCFLAEMDGELYFLGVQEDTGAEWYPPQLGHKVLVEGTVQPGPRVCGGIPLHPIVTSVIPDLDLSCNTLLPAEEGIEAPDVPRGPGPSSEKPAPRPPRRAEEPPRAPFEPREFTIVFDFDNDFMSRHLTPIVGQAVAYAKVIGPTAKVSVTTYRGATLLSNGETLVESTATGARRSKKLEDVLLGLGIPTSSLTITTRTEPETPTGVGDDHSRRVVIRVAP